MNLKRLNGHSAVTITSALNISTSYLVVMALRSSLVQLKGLFVQPSLPLPLPLRALRAVRGAVALISEGNQKKSCINVTVNDGNSELGKVDETCT